MPQFDSQSTPLGSRIDRLERRQQLMMGLIDREKNPLSYLMLEYDISEEEDAAISRTLDSAHAALEAGKPLDKTDFELQIVPAGRPADVAWNFPRALIRILARSGQYPLVVEQFRSDYDIK